MNWHVGSWDPFQTELENRLTGDGRVGRQAGRQAEGAQPLAPERAPSVGGKFPLQGLRCRAQA